MISGRNGSGFLRASSKSPSAASFFLRFSSIAISAPSPATATRVALSANFEENPDAVILPSATTSMPSSGIVSSPATCPFQVRHWSTDLSSFRSK